MEREEVWVGRPGGSAISKQEAGSADAVVVMKWGSMEGKGHQGNLLVPDWMRRIGWRLDLEQREVAEACG